MIFLKNVRELFLSQLLYIQQLHSTNGVMDNKVWSASKRDGKKEDLLINERSFNYWVRFYLLCLNIKNPVRNSFVGLSSKNRVGGYNKCHSEWVLLVIFSWSWNILQSRFDRKSFLYLSKKIFRVLGWIHKVDSSGVTTPLMFEKKASDYAGNEERLYTSNKDILIILYRRLRAYWIGSNSLSYTE